MPYVSDKQRRFMHARHPKIAARWDKKYGGGVRKSTRGSPSMTMKELACGYRKVK